MAALKYSQRFFRSAKHLSPSERIALARTLRALEGAEALPSDADTPTILPPSLPVLRRRVEASDRYLYFTVGEDGSVFVICAAAFV